MRIVAIPSVIMNRLNKTESAAFLYCRLSLFLKDSFFRLFTGSLKLINIHFDRKMKQIGQFCTVLSSKQYLQVFKVGHFQNRHHSVRYFEFSIDQ